MPRKQVALIDDEVCCPSVTAAPLSEDDANDLARVFAALADPVRLRLLSLVAEAGEICSCDLLEPLGKSQPTISHHTKALADVGLDLRYQAGSLGLVEHRARTPQRASTRTRSRAPPLTRRSAQARHRRTALARYEIERTP